MAGKIATTKMAYIGRVQNVDKFTAEVGLTRQELGQYKDSLNINKPAYSHSVNFKQYGIFLIVPWVNYALMHSENGSVFDPIPALIEFAEKRKLPKPTFDELSTKIYQDWNELKLMARYLQIDVPGPKEVDMVCRFFVFMNKGNLRTKEIWARPTVNNDYHLVMEQVRNINIELNKKEIKD